jgi:hypothetical protein
MTGDEINIADLRRKRFGVYRTTDKLANAHAILIERRKGRDCFWDGGLNGKIIKRTITKLGLWMWTEFIWYSGYANESQRLFNL